MKMIKTTVIKPHMGPDGVIVQRGASITVDETRHRQLLRKGYVPKLDDVAVDETSREPREGLTNADFNPRRTSIVGDGSAAEKAKPAAPKAKAEKAKPAAPPDQSQQSTEGTGQA